MRLADSPAAGAPAQNPPMLSALLLLAAAVVALLAWAASRPSSFRIERAARIDAPAARIAPLLTDFRRWQQWSPWEKLDPALERRFSGAEAGVGAVYEWRGNAKAGQGRMEITGATPELVTIRLDFIKPFPATNTAEFRLAPMGDATDVGWAMFGERPFMVKLVGVFMDMDKLVGKDFEAGLAAMKQVAERGG
jgi:hypothetical protein